MPAEVRETSLKTGFMSLDVILLAFVEIFTSFLFILFYIYIFFFSNKDGIRRILEGSFLLKCSSAKFKHFQF